MWGCCDTSKKMSVAIKASSDVSPSVGHLIKLASNKELDIIWVKVLVVLQLMFRR